MKSCLSLALVALAAVSATAQKIQSKPFYLKLTSKVAALDGHALFACHEGAAIEGLCLGDKLQPANKSLTFTAFHFNHTKDDANSGLLTYKLVGANFVLSEPMAFSIDPTSNVAVALFGASEQTQYVSFDKQNRMYVTGYVDDTVTPPKTAQTPTKFYRWYACVTNISGYTYTTLSWVLGNQKPENPSCKKVDVVRVFK